MRARRAPLLRRGPRRQGRGVERSRVPPVFRGRVAFQGVRHRGELLHTLILQRGRLAELLRAVPERVRLRLFRGERPLRGEGVGEVLLSRVVRPVAPVGGARGGLVPTKNLVRSSDRRPL